MIQKTINVYPYKELNEKAKEYARRERNAHNDLSFIQEFMTEYLKEELTEKGIKYNDDLKVFYSLSYCQGDGAMFQGLITWKDLDIKITHTGRYYHAYMKNIETIDKDFVSENEAKEFENLYVSICKDLEKYGYDLIETEQSAENFAEECEANDYLFLSDGERYKE